MSQISNLPLMDVIDTLLWSHGVIINALFMEPTHAHARKARMKSPIQKLFQR